MARPHRTVLLRARAARAARSAVFALALASAAGACGGERDAGTGSADPATAAAPPAAPEQPAAPAEPAGPEVVRDSFALAARPEAEGYAAGELGQFEIVLEGRSGWHLNQEYPIAVELSGPDAVRFEKSRLERADAAEFGEPRARFAVALTPSASGEQTVRAHVAFAMCTAENCTMHDETLALVLPVR